MRTAPDQVVLRDWLHRIGNGIPEVVTPVRDKHNMNWITIPAENTSKKIEEIIDFCFPSVLFENPLQNAGSIAENANLCPTNDDVAEINTMALKRMIGDATTFKSIDSPLDNDQGYITTNRSDFNLEAIHNETPSGMPPHILEIKVINTLFIDL